MLIRLELIREKLLYFKGTNIVCDEFFLPFIRCFIGCVYSVYYSVYYFRELKTKI